MTALASDTFSCGHARTAENTGASGGSGYPACHMCLLAKRKQRWAGQDAAERQMDYKARALPGQLLRAIRRVQHLTNEHERYGMKLEKEAQQMLHDLYGPLAPGFHAEEEYQRARRG